MLANFLWVCNNAGLASTDEVIEIPGFNAAVSTRTKHSATTRLQAAYSTIVTSTIVSIQVNHYHHCYVYLDYTLI